MASRVKTARVQRNLRDEAARRYSPDILIKTFVSNWSFLRKHESSWCDFQLANTYMVRSLKLPKGPLNDLVERRLRKTQRDDSKRRSWHESLKRNLNFARRKLSTDKPHPPSPFSKLISASTEPLPTPVARPARLRQNDTTTRPVTASRKSPAPTADLPLIVGR